MRIVYDMDIIEFANRHRDVLQKVGFLEWLPTNTHIYWAFELLADKLWDMGRHYYSARRIGEGMRWEHEIRSNDEFKISNNITSYLGRLYVLRHPDRINLFSYKVKDVDFKAYVKFHQMMGQL